MIRIEVIALLLSLTLSRISARFCKLDHQPVVTARFNDISGSYERIENVRNIRLLWGVGRSQTDRLQRQNEAYPIIYARACFCAEFLDQVIDYCPVQFNKCSLVIGAPSQCFSTQREVSFIRGLVSFMIAWYVAGTYVLVGTEWGRSVRAYVSRKLRSWQHRDLEILEEQTAQLQSRNPDRANRLFWRGFQRQRRTRLQQIRREEREYGEHNRIVPVAPSNDMRTDMMTYQEEVLDPTQLAIRRTRMQAPTARPTQLKLRTKTYVLANEWKDSGKGEPRESSDSETSGCVAGNTLLAFRSEKEDGIEMERGSLCAICLDRLVVGDRVGDLMCQHMFHVDCLKVWLKRKNQCPLCNTQNVAAPSFDIPVLMEAASPVSNARYQSGDGGETQSLAAEVSESQDSTNGASQDHTPSDDAV